MKTNKPTNRSFPIVGIGASAGGLEALDEFLKHLPPDTGMAFVVLTHQHPEHTSLLPELLARETKMPVVAATDGIRLEPDHIYVGTPGGQLTIHDAVLRRTASDAHAVRLPIDSFFRSLAEDQKQHAICIVLSGTGSDGTLGLKAIKAESGMAMVQQSQSAKYAGMPSSAEATGMADYVLTPAEMPEHLVAYARGPYLRGTRPNDGSWSADQPVVIEAEPMARLFQLLRSHTGNDFSGYKSNTIRRRIERRMNIHQITKPEDYVHFLEQNTHEIELLFKELLISVTSFLRDPESWDAFANGPLTQLMTSAGNDATLRAWVPGCATGEEVYTLAIFAPQNLIKDPPFTKLDIVTCRNLLIYLDADVQKQLMPICVGNRRRSRSTKRAGQDQRRLHARELGRPTDHSSRISGRFGIHHVSAL